MGRPRYYKDMPEEPLANNSTNRHLDPHPPKHGSTAGIIIIILLLLALGAYFGLVRLKERRKAMQQIPYIPSSTTTITIVEPPSTGK